MNRSIRRAILVLATLFIVTACAADSLQGLKMAPPNMLPVKIQRAPARVREAYQFAVANPDALKNVPCYCGCGAVGHTSNYACYVKSDSGGTVVFDEHSLGCSLCVEITRDVMRLSREGTSPGDIRAFIVSTYSRFGPPNQ